MVATLAALAGASAATAAPIFAPTPVNAEAGTDTAIAHWEIQSSAKAQQAGAEVSAAGFSTKEWYPVSGRATAMAGLLENDTYKDIFYSDNLRAAEEPDSSGNVFVIPWWYRTEFTLGAGAPSARTLVRINGIIASADVWLNGNLIADQAAIAGAYPVHEIDVTRWVHLGTNTLALRVRPADARNSLSIGWVDWNPTPPDNNMGPWRGVDIVRTGPVRILYPQVTSALSLPDLSHAALTVRVGARNLDDSAHDATLTAVVAGVALRRTIHLVPGETRTVEFSAKTDPGLNIRQPKIWWPRDMGAQPLYDLQATASVDGATSDRASTTFGIRSVTSHLTPQGYRQFIINGKPVLLRGAGWASDMFLRDDPKRMEAEFSYVVNLGLNTLRSEGKLEDARFYDLADREGIMVLAGWECCDKWESWAKTGGEPWTAADEKIAAASMVTEAELLRNHPSVIGFLIGSDNAPPSSVSKIYTDALHETDWPLPIIAAAVPKGTPETGLSGMKMDGPYSWVPPLYWYADKLGGAYGFDSEVSAGASIPLMDDLKRMLSPLEQEVLWKDPQARQFHASAAWSTFANDRALLHRARASLRRPQGPCPISSPRRSWRTTTTSGRNSRRSMRAWMRPSPRRASSTGCSTTRGRRCTGICTTISSIRPAPTSAPRWPTSRCTSSTPTTRARSSWSITPSASEHGLQATHPGAQPRWRSALRTAPAGHHACRQRHEAVGDAAGRRPDCRASTSSSCELAACRRQAGQPQCVLAVHPERRARLGAFELVSHARDAIRGPDPIAVPAARDERGPGHDEARGAGDIATVTLTVPPSSRAVALFQHVSIRRSAGGELMLPILWSDNDVTLWPGESLTLTAHFATPEAATPVVEVSGWNVPTQSVRGCCRESGGRCAAE